MTDDVGLDVTFAAFTLSSRNLRDLRILARDFREFSFATFSRLRLLSLLLRGHRDLSIGTRLGRQVGRGNVAVGDLVVLGHVFAAGRLATVDGRVIRFALLAYFSLRVAKTKIESS